MTKISVVINTHNEESNLKRCLQSIIDFADEIVVVDQNSSDKTVEIAKKFGAKIFKHPHTRIVEPARNFALSKASSDWIFIIDADEEASLELLARLKKIAQEGNADYVLIPRKNLIFGKWLRHSRWWPDYNIRFFKKGKVSWDEKIHSIPITLGEGEEIPAEENLALIHYNYTSVDQYLERNARYAQFRASQLIKEGYHFSVEDLIRKPVNEFLSRYFEGEGYKDGLHGLILAGLQSFSEFLVYLKIWEKEGFGHQEVSPSAPFFQQSINDFNFWQAKTSGLIQKIRLKIKSLI
jgi:(heptosyl)LPS beta-1,4-glucosyltransferase